MNVAAGPHQAPKKRSGCMRLLGFGCMGFVVFLIIGAIIVYYNFRAITAWRVEYLLEKSLETTKMDEAKKDAIREQVGRVLTAFEEETVTDEQLTAVVADLRDDPLVPCLVSILIMTDIVPNLSLTAEESASLEKELSRLTLAVEEGKMNGKGYEEVIKHLMMVRDGEQVPGLKGDATKEELLALRDKAKAKADELEILDAHYDYDFVDALERHVNDALGTEEL